MNELMKKDKIEDMIYEIRVSKHVEIGRVLKIKL